MLTLLDVRSGYGRSEILHGVGLEVRAGEVAAIIGPNGAGKSVLLKTITGLLPCRSGKILFDDRDVTGLNANARFQLGITYVPQAAVVFPDMTVEENIVMGAITERRGDQLRAALQRTYESFPALLERRHQAAGSMSGGQQRQVALARVLMRTPRLVLLDEPSIGLDPKALASLRRNIRTLTDWNITVVLVEQNVRFALRVAEVANVLALGQIVHRDRAENLRGRKDLFKFYLSGGVPAEA